MFRSLAYFSKLLDKATSNLRLEPDWPTILQICDVIRQGDVQPKPALAAIKRKLTNPNPHIAFFSLLVLESCVKNCGSLIHDEIGTKQYMEQLRELVKTTPHENVRLKLLELIQAWTFAFRNSPKYRAVQDTMNVLKAEGYKFPTLKESDAMFSADTAPAWADADVCHRCRVAFSMVQRKHHCRACGQVFCGQCSSKMSTLPKFGIEKEVRVCEACYDQVNKPTTTAPKETDLPAEYLNSSLAQQQQVPPRKTAEELQEEEELQLALALSQSEAEQKEKEKKRATSALKSNPTPVSRAAYSPPSSPGPSPSRVQEEEEETDPELAKYLNRKYWEQRQTAIEEHSSRADIASPSAPNISSPMPQKVIVAKSQNEEVDTQMEEFVGALRSQVEIFVNRMKSNSSRGRSIANDSSVQTLFMNITAMHSRLLKHIQEQDDSRVYYEGLQDKLAQMKDARAALDALREEHREKLRRLAEEAERQRQLQMAQKLEIMRKKKQEYLQYQRQLALQRIQEQEREMQMRQEQQKQQYIMGNYQQVPGFMGPSAQGSPIRHGQYSGPTSNYNPMSPTNQGVYIYGGQPAMGQYQMPGYGMPSMGPMPAHMMGAMGNQEPQGSADPSVQGRENLGRVSISGPGMIPGPPMPQMQQPSGHKINQQGPAHMVPPQGPPEHMGAPGSQGPPGPIVQPSGQSVQVGPPQSGPVGQMGPASVQMISQGPPQGPPGQMGPLQGPAGQMGPPQGPPGQMGRPQGPPGQMGPPQGPPGQMGPPQGPPGQMGPPQGPPGQMGPPQGPPSQMGPSQGPSGPIGPPQGPPSQIGVPPSHGPPSSMGQQGPTSLPQGAPLQQPASTNLPPHGTGSMQLPSGPPGRPIQGSQGHGLPSIQGTAQISAPSGPPMQFQPTSSQPASVNGVHTKESKPDTAELISFD
ncbi:hepatocyte growth factor-regulated tyrosine kinase substrate isoform X2 [Cephus cinctus]|uniref:Hepatocyte growth factor-regulated tyrosine kinase substrate n=1 Tax=Cephus cinctus TaxID=211228 RepID=A0AAJ7BWY0_CEPCN|nr:hepatocyte growth factor-regulated tyrosine kinase substrate isoform X2 [Cephus cinctus]